MSNELAREKAAKLLRKRGSQSTIASVDILQATAAANAAALKPPQSSQKKYQTTSSVVSYQDDALGDDQAKTAVKLENTYRTGPSKRFPETQVSGILRDVLESYLKEERYEPELCRQMTKTLSEVVKARVKELQIPRYKVIALITIGQIKDQGARVGSRCLWDAHVDTFSSYEFRNSSLFAVGTVYGVYAE